MRRNEASGVRVYETASGISQVFIETLAPPVPLVVFGAGADALPIIDLAHCLGWKTEVVDPQGRAITRTRFAHAGKVTLARPESVAHQVAITSRTLTLLMTHNYAHDLALLEFLLASHARYIGALGPRKRTERMLRELSDDGFAPTDSDRARLYAPAGLDIGADSSEEIALAIIGDARRARRPRRRHPATPADADTRLARRRGRRSGVAKSREESTSGCGSSKHISKDRNVSDLIVMGSKAWTPPSWC